MCIWRTSLEYFRNQRKVIYLVVNMSEELGNQVFLDKQLIIEISPEKKLSGNGLSSLKKYKHIVILQFIK